MNLGDRRVLNSTVTWNAVNVTPTQEAFSFFREIRLESMKEGTRAAGGCKRSSTMDEQLLYFDFAAGFLVFELLRIPLSSVGHRVGT